MFGYDDIREVVVTIGDPLADMDIALFKVPSGFTAEIIEAWAWDDKTLVSGTANYFDLALYNGGTVGTATAAVAGTIGGSAQAWTAMSKVSFTISEGTMTDGQVLWVRYNETGTVAQHISIGLTYRLGVAAA